MKNLKQILFMLAMVIGLAVSGSAQKGDDPRQRPPKEKPPVIKPGDKPPPRGNPPKGDDRPKKPGMAYYFVSVGKEDEVAD